MTIVEQLARFLAARLRLPFEGADAGGAVFFGWMPEAPAKAVCVYAADLRRGDDDAGSRVQVAIRSDADGAWPLGIAAEIMRQLDGRRDAMFTPGGSYVHRVEALRGFEFNGMEGNGTQIYTAEFRVFECGGDEGHRE